MEIAIEWEYRIHANWNVTTWRRSWLFNSNHFYINWLQTKSELRELCIIKTVCKSCKLQQIEVGGGGLVDKETHLWLEASLCYVTCNKSKQIIIAWRSLTRNMYGINFLNIYKDLIVSKIYCKLYIITRLPECPCTSKITIPILLIICTCFFVDIWVDKEAQG